MRLALAVGLAFVAGCFNPKLDDEPFDCGPGPEPCPPGYSCDVGRNVCVKQLPDAGTTMCQPGAARCDGDMLVTCPQGTVISTPCPVGCGDLNGSGAACLTLVPTGLSNETCASSTSATLHVVGPQTYNTDTCAGGSMLANPPRCVVSVANLTVEAGATLTVTGTRIPVLVATKKARILGTIDVAAKGMFSGPGGAAADPDGRGDMADQSSSDGGGGAGYATKGGQGGANPGNAYGSADLSPILPGAAGGAGGFGCRDICPLPALVPADGGAGGAAQIVACAELELGSAAVLSAGGGGGPGGHGGDFQAPPGGGGGGGSGGAILLEAPEITVGGGVGVVANGGGGGGGGAMGADLTGPDGQPGEDGRTSATPAKGGPGGNGGAGVGGNGGTADGRGSGVLPGRGTSSRSGGGGAAGRIRFNARPDKPVTLSGAAIVSPAPSTGNITRR